MLTYVSSTIGYLKSRKGQGMTEYAVIVALVVAIALIVMASNGSLAEAINAAFGKTATKVNGI